MMDYAEQVLLQLAEKFSIMPDDEYEKIYQSAVRKMRDFPHIQEMVRVQCNVFFHPGKKDTPYITDSIPSRYNDVFNTLDAWGYGQCAA